MDDMLLIRARLALDAGRIDEARMWLALHGTLMAHQRLMRNTPA